LQHDAVRLSLPTQLPESNLDRLPTRSQILLFYVWGAAVLPDQSLAGASSLSEITAKRGLAAE
jgi:hypothetical protein